jgi:hypothetical protein
VPHFRSNQDSHSIHVAPLNRSVSPQSTAKAFENSVKLHEPTVHSARGHVKAGGSMKIEAAPPVVTPAQSAEAAAASAFEPLSPNTPMPDVIFAPKISSVDTYSSASSPTAHFDSPVPGTPQETKMYETSARGKVFGGQDTSASSKKRPNENPFNMHEKLPLTSKE